MRFVYLLVCLFCGSLVAGALLAGGQFHVLLGLVAAVCLICSHVLAFFYVIETSVQIKRAVRQRGLDPTFNVRHEPHKKRVFPVAFLAMVSMVAAAVTGGAADSGVLPPWVHGTLIYLALAATLAAWPVELWALRGTRRLLGEVNSLLTAEAPPPTVRQPEEVGQRPEEGLWLLGRFLAFGGVSLWGIYGYLLLVIQTRVGVWPYVALSVPLVLCGWWLQRRYAFAGPEQQGHAPPLHRA